MGKSVGVLAFLVLVGLLTVSVAAKDGVSLWLEDLTGETDLRQQLEGVALLFRLRPVDTQDMAPVAYGGVRPFGANTFFEQEVEEWKIRKTMEMLRDAGIRWIRQEMPWDRIEIPAKGQYFGPYGGTWAPYDRFINLAREYRLDIVARLDLPPPWAKADNSVPRSPPDNYKDYGDFVYTFVNRYKGRIKYYQIWNEPNLYLEWGGVPDAQKYVDLLKIAHSRAKEADPDAVILSAPLSQTLGTLDGLNESDLVYLQKMYDAGAKDYFDILSAQAHGLWTGPGDRRTEESQTNFSRLRLIREIMVKNGDASKAIWISEVGWNALPPDFPGPAIHGRVTEERQARYTQGAYRRIQEEWPWTGGVFYWYFRKVSDEARREEDFYYRMVDPDFTPRPVYWALKDVAAAPPVVQRGFHQEDHWALEYRGKWSKRKGDQAVLGSYVESGEPGASLTFSFRGTGLTLVTAKGPQEGKLFVTLDGGTSRISGLPRDEERRGRAFLDLRASEAVWGVRVPVAWGLQDKVHTVKIEVWDGNITIDGLIVERDPISYTVRMIVGVCLLLGVVLAMVPSLLRPSRGANSSHAEESYLS